MTRKAHKPTAETQQMVRDHATVGTPQETIADLLEIDAKTLRKYYRTELDHSAAQANAAIGGALYNKALNGDTTAMIFWMKTRAGWREKDRDDLPPTMDQVIEVIRATKV